MPSYSKITYADFSLFLASGDFFFVANSLGPDQDRLNVGLDIDPNRLTLWLCSWKIFLKKNNFEKKLADANKSMRSVSEPVFYGDCFIHSKVISDTSFSDHFKLIIKCFCKSLMKCAYYAFSYFTNCIQ